MAMALEQRVGDQGLDETVLCEWQVSARHRHCPGNPRVIRATGSVREG
jgi:hypothetical protein